jgi:hypothetical protein
MIVLCSKARHIGPPWSTPSAEWGRSRVFACSDVVLSSRTWLHPWGHAHINSEMLYIFFGFYFLSACLDLWAEQVQKEKPPLKDIKRWTERKERHKTGSFQQHTDSIEEIEEHSSVKALDPKHPKGYGTGYGQEIWERCSQKIWMLWDIYA